MISNYLHRLPNGTWIRLSEVTRVYVFANKYNGTVDVTVVCGESHTALLFDDQTSAQIYADELAALANEACDQKSAMPDANG